MILSLKNCVKMTHIINRTERKLLMNLVIFQPDIPQNTGAMVRICSCFDVDIELIHPASFPLNDKSLKRVSMDYGNNIKITQHNSWKEYKKSISNEQRIILLSTKGVINYSDFRFIKDDHIMVGKESAGVPNDIHKEVSEVIRIPMSENSRSLNVATSAAIVLSEAMRQLKIEL